MLDPLSAPVPQGHSTLNLNGAMVTHGAENVLCAILQNFASYDWCKDAAQRTEYIEFMSREWFRRRLQSGDRIDVRDPSGKVVREVMLAAIPDLDEPGPPTCELFVLDDKAMQDLSADLAEAQRRRAGG